MRFKSLVEITTAFHLAPRVAGNVGEERGGLMLVAPPGQLKTTAIEYLDQFPKTRLLSNVTVKTLNALRQDFVAGEIQTLAFPDYDMLYKRHGSVSSQIEGTLMGLSGEGFRNPAFSDQRVSVLKARCTVIGGVTIKCYERMISEWIDSGFARRFLWSRYSVSNSEKLEAALTEWRRAELDGGDFVMKVPQNLIPHKLTKREAEKVLWQLRFQPDRKIPFIMCQRVISVLLWKYPEKGWDIWEDFAPSLGKDGALVTV